jgi:Multicopper oxidase
MRMRFSILALVTSQFNYLTVGQRYDVVINANQAVGAYWLRAIPQSCSATNQNQNNIRAVVRYVGANLSDPTTTGYNYTDECVDETSLVPVVTRSPSSLAFGDRFDVTISTANNIFRWQINGSTFVIDW